MNLQQKTDGELLKVKTEEACGELLSRGCDEDVVVGDVGYVTIDRIRGVKMTGRVQRLLKAVQEGMTS